MVKGNGYGKLIHPTAMQLKFYAMRKPSCFGKIFAIAGIFLLQISFGFCASTWFIATNGIDTNAGTSNAPFATIMRAQTAASSNDTVYLRGGTYYLDNSNVTFTNSP